MTTEIDAVPLTGFCGFVQRGGNVLKEQHQETCLQAGRPDPFFAIQEYSGIRV